MTDSDVIGDSKAIIQVRSSLNSFMDGLAKMSFEGFGFLLKLEMTIDQRS